jgi:hypothetical protein
MSLLVDTGSSLTWIPSSECSKSQCPGKVFAHKQSRSFKNHTLEEVVKYGSTTIKGYLVNDVVTADQNLGDENPSARVNFLGAYETQNLYDMNGDGLMGLSPRIP